MKNKNIKDTFEFFSPSKEQEEKIYKSITDRQQSNDVKIRTHFKAKLVPAVIACIVLSVFAIIMLDNIVSNDHIALLEPGSTQYNMAELPSVNDSNPAADDKKTVFKGLVLTAYAANGEISYLSANYEEETEKAVLTPEVKILLAQYTPAMSSVPGFPFTVDTIKEDGDGNHVETINVSADRGALSKWDRGTGVVSPGSQSVEIDRGETIYWSPLGNEDTSDIKHITITVEAVANNAVVGRQNIYITQDGSGNYYATVGELELI